ncbi:MAG: hypothetical protein K2X66_07400, partial [Cyanobacteria bacterium]|nr:hypothetical protein [Cyanobacteriota bacterium]
MNSISPFLIPLSVNRFGANGQRPQGAPQLAPQPLPVQLPKKINVPAPTPAKPKTLVPQGLPIQKPEPQPGGNLPPQNPNGTGSGTAKDPLANPLPV